MRRGGNTDLFCHLAFPPGALWRPGHAARSQEEARIRTGREWAEGMTGETLAGHEPGRAEPAWVGSQDVQPAYAAEQAVETFDPHAEILWPSRRMRPKGSTLTGPFRHRCGHTLAALPLPD